MRLQDELAGLHAASQPGGGGLTQRYVLGRLPELPIRFDSDELEALLAGARLEKDSRVAGQAAWAWGRIGPDLTAHAYGLDDDRLGLWSALALSDEAVQEGSGLRAQVTRPRTVQSEGGGEAGSTATEPDPRQASALAAMLAPCHEAILSAATRPGLAGDLAREIVGLLPIPGGEEALRTAAQDAGCALTALLSLARRNRALAAGALGTERGLPLWLRTLAAGSVGGPEAFDIAMKAATHGEESSRWGAALTIPAVLELDWAALARRLLRAEGGWVRVIVLDALGQSAPAIVNSGSAAKGELLRLVDAALKQGGHDMIRIAAIRALAAARQDLSVRRAKRCLEKGSPQLQAASIEALTVLGHDTPEYRRTLTQRAVEGVPKLRALAVLGLMALDREAALQAAIALVRTREPTARLEGAYCLGYLHCTTSLNLLAVLARQDRFMPGAIQATKSLANFPETEATPILKTLLEHPRPEIALCALRTLSHFSGQALGDVVKALRSLDARLSPEDRRTMLRHAGRLGPTTKGLAEFLSETHGDGAGQIGALEGLARIGEIDVSSESPAAVAARSPDRRIGLFGALAQAIGGARAGVDALARLSARQADGPAALAAVRELSVLGAAAGRGGRLMKLQALLVSPMRSGASGTSGASGRLVRTQTDAAATARLARGPVDAQRSVPVPMKPVRTPDSTEVLRRITGTDRETLVDQVTRELETQADVSTDAPGHSWVLNVTYVHDKGLAMLSGARSLAWLPPSVRPYAPLLAASLLLIIPLGIVGIQYRSIEVQSGTRVGSHAPLSDGQMRVTDVKGIVQRAAAAGRPASSLSIHECIGPGDSVTTASGARVMLADAKGNSLYLGESSRVRLGVPAGEATTPSITPYLVDDPAGDVLIDLRKVPALEIVIGNARLLGSPGTVRILDDARGRMVAVTQGQLSLTAPGKPPRKLFPGETVTLSAP